MAILVFYPLGVWTRTLFLILYKMKRFLLDLPAAVHQLPFHMQKETLTNEVEQKNSESTSRYNSELRKYKQYSDSKAPTLYRIVNNLRKECEGLIHDTIQGPVQKLPWKFLERDALSEDVILSKLRSYKKRNPKLIIEEARYKIFMGA